MSQQEDIEEELTVDIYVHEDRMYATVDLSRHLDIIESELEINLISRTTSSMVFGSRDAMGTGLIK